MAFEVSFTVLHFVVVLMAHHASLGMIINNEPKVSSPAEVTFFQMRDANYENLNIRVNTFGKTYDLELFKAPSVFSPTYEEYETREDQHGNHVIEKVTVDPLQQHQIESKFYINAEGTSSLSIQERDGQLILEGILDHGLYITKTDPTDRVQDGKIHHVAIKQPAVSPAYQCQVLTPNITFAEPSIKETAPELRQLPNLVQPEVLLVIEYNYYGYFNRNPNSVKQYLGIFFNSVNRRYNTISKPKIQNVISGLILITSPSDETFKVVRAGTLIDASTTLPNFGKWLYDRRNSIKVNYDVAMWITSLDLVAPSGTTYNNGLLGVAYIGRACDTTPGRYMKVGLSEDKPGQYTGIHTVTHELGHLYGAAHDGYTAVYPPGNPGSVNCPWKDGYIMSYEYGTPRKMYFSSCSAKSFEFTIRSPSGSCLRNKPSRVEVPLTSTLPGTLISLDNQCKAIHGSGFYFYTPYIDKVCVTLTCAIAQGRNVYLRSGDPALEGSFCDQAKTKWCINGVCVRK